MSFRAEISEFTQPLSREVWPTGPGEVPSKLKKMHFGCEQSSDYSNMEVLLHKVLYPEYGDLHDQSWVLVTECRVFLSES